jgi:hypothetical protein
VGKLGLFEPNNTSLVNASNYFRHWINSPLSTSSNISDISVSTPAILPSSTSMARFVFSMPTMAVRIAAAHFSYRLTLASLTAK